MEGERSKSVRSDTWRVARFVGRTSLTAPQNLAAILLIFFSFTSSTVEHCCNERQIYATIHIFLRAIVIVSCDRSRAHCRHLAKARLLGLAENLRMLEAKLGAGRCAKSSMAKFGPARFAGSDFAAGLRCLASRSHVLDLVLAVSSLRKLLVLLLPCLKRAAILVNQIGRAHV